MFLIVSIIWWASHWDKFQDPSEALQMSLRFEMLMSEYRRTSTNSDLSDVDLLHSLMDRYNNYKSNTAIRKWQLSDDMKRSIEGIVIGMTPDSRALVRMHLDFNKWEESGPLFMSNTFFGLLCWVSFSVWLPMGLFNVF